MRCCRERACSFRFFGRSEPLPYVVVNVSFVVGHSVYDVPNAVRRKPPNPTIYQSSVINDIEHSSCPEILDINHSGAVGTIVEIRLDIGCRKGSYINISLAGRFGYNTS